MFAKNFDARLNAKEADPRLSVGSIVATVGRSRITLLDSADLAASREVSRFLGGRTETFPPDTMEIKFTQYGVEVVTRGQEESVRVLFPWAQIEKVTQRGANVAAVYTY